MNKQNQDQTVIKRSLNGRILRRTISVLLTLVVVCCTIMVLSMLSLTYSILQDNLPPLVRQSSKTVEANIHVLADRMISIAGNSGLQSEDTRMDVLNYVQTVYELDTIALYDLNGNLMEGSPGAAFSLDSNFFSLLSSTANLTTDRNTYSSRGMGITMGMPVTIDGTVAFYVVGVYKYDALSDVLNDIHVGINGYAMVVNLEGKLVGHRDESLVTSSTLLTSLDPGYADVYDRLIGRETGAMEITVDGEKLIAAYAPIRGTQWSLLIQVPEDDFNGLTNSAVKLTFSVAAILLLIAFVLIYRLSRSISIPAKQAAARMTGLSQGDLHSPVQTVHTGDELELLTTNMSDAMGQIENYVSEIDRILSHIANGDLTVSPEGDYKGDFALIRDSLTNIIGSLNETMAGFGGAAEHLAGMAELLSNQSNELHQASNEQSQSAAELVDSVSTAHARLSIVSQDTAQTKQKTDDISEKLHTANEQMNQLSQAMDSIHLNVNEITKLAKTIGDIAFQTNILAINASVEAARAGDAGKGFSVVAEEVRNLANRSAEAAESAETMMANTRSIIQTGVELTQGTVNSLHGVSRVADEIEQVTQQLTVAVEEQVGSLNEMKNRIDIISNIADRNLQNAQDTAQSSGLLALEADALQDRVRKFTWKEEK